VCAFNFSVGISKKREKRQRGKERENCENVEKACKMQPLDILTMCVYVCECVCVFVVSLCMFVASSSFIIFALLLCNSFYSYFPPGGIFRHYSLEVTSTILTDYLTLIGFSLK